jgi:hypothetical protein
MRLPLEPLWASPGPARLTAALSGVFLSPWLSLMRWHMDRAGVDYNDQLFGVAATGAMNEERMLEILARLPPGVTEIYLHPATQSGAAVNASQGGYQHADELAALLSPRVREALAQAQVPTGGYAGIAAARASWGPVEE